MGYYDYDDYWDNKYDVKIRALENFRKNALGLGTRKLKLRLNKLINGKDVRNNDIPEEIQEKAELYRTLIELEDKNIQAKKTYGCFRKRIYNEKDKLLVELVSLLIGIEYKEERGFAFDKNFDMTVLYVDLKIGEKIRQVSWHISTYTMISKSIINKYEYKKPWDGEKNVTYNRIIKGIKYNFMRYIK